MAIDIPNKAFLSFSFRQCVNTLYRIGIQIEQQWEHQQNREKALGILKENLKSLSAHEDLRIKLFVSELMSLFPKSNRGMQDWLMHIERHQQQDLKDSDFLISSEDTANRKMKETVPVHLVLDNLRSSFNVGSIFRTAEALGARSIHLCGYTPTPENSKTGKSALGSDLWVEWKYWESTLECLDFLHKEGVILYGFETTACAVDLRESLPVFPCALVLGNERYGLSETILKRMDHLLQIKMTGRKNSLNVSICAAIALNHFSSQQGQ